MQSSVARLRIIRKSQWQNAVVIQGRTTQPGMIRKSLRRRAWWPPSRVTQGGTGRNSPRDNCAPPGGGENCALPGGSESLFKTLSVKFARGMRLACCTIPGRHLWTVACHLRVACTMACHLAFHLHAACKHDMPLGKPLTCPCHYGCNLGKRAWKTACNLRKVAGRWRAAYDFRFQLLAVVALGNLHDTVACRLHAIVMPAACRGPRWHATFQW